MTYRQEHRAIHRLCYYQRCRIELYRSCAARKLLRQGRDQRGEPGSGLRSVLEGGLIISLLRS